MTRAGCSLVNLFEGFLAVPGGNDRVALEAQGDFEQFEHVRDVFDNQDRTVGNIIHNEAIVAGFMAADKCVYL